jgi:multisubunit Na+/H+ antiporter MnhB subunit
MKILWCMIVLAACSALGGMLVLAMLQLPPPLINLAPGIAANLDASGAAHPVTAVLLNFRGYDTLLEIAVLLLALLSVLSVVHDRPAPPPPRRPGLPLLQSLARILAPLMVLVAGYLLWAGSHQPGGAFQAGAVLAATAVLLHLARLLPAWTSPHLLLRVGLTGGLLVFLAVAALLMHSGKMLQYPPAAAGMLILLIESGLTLSLGLVLAGLFLALSEDEEGPE